MTGDVDGGDRPVADDDLLARAHEPLVDGASVERAAVPACRRHLVVALLDERSIEGMGDDATAQSAPKRMGAAGVIEVAVGDEQPTDVLGPRAGGFDVCEQQVGGLPAARIDEGRAARHADEIDRRVFGRGQSAAADLADLVGDLPCMWSQTRPRLFCK